MLLIQSAHLDSFFKVQSQLGTSELFTDAPEGCLKEWHLPLVSKDIGEVIDELRVVPSVLLCEIYGSCDELLAIRSTGEREQRSDGLRSGHLLAALEAELVDFSHEGLAGGVNAPDEQCGKGRSGTAPQGSVKVVYAGALWAGFLDGSP